MTLLAAVHHHRGLAWGIVLVGIGLAHLAFPAFYVRREKAVHDARQDTAPALTRPFYRRHGSTWYWRWTVWGGSAMVVIGAIDIALTA